MLGLVSDGLAWAAVVIFLTGVALWPRRRETGRRVLTVAWGVFGLFWLQLVPHFAFVQKSFVEGFGALLAVPLCWYAGYHLYGGRDSLVTLSRSVAWMGLIYLPFQTIPAVVVGGTTIPAPRTVLIRLVTAQTEWVIEVLGYEPVLVTGDTGLLNTFRFVTPEGHVILFSLILACTGLGSISIFAGLIAAADAPFGRKLRALAVAVPVIYALNLVRTTFIALVFGKQYMQWFVDEVLLLFGGSDPYMVSFYLSDRVVSQSLAVVALVAVTYLVLRELPELLQVVEDTLYLLTRREYDLADALNLPRQP
ncbi:archaeosortase A [Salinirubellus sp. GCM10025818]|uniref:archaeosortase A n=1 Tax=Salinirubellus TaxID=2162630 RepID=UPI0030CAADCC